MFLADADSFGIDAVSAEAAAEPGFVDGVAVVGFAPGFICEPAESGDEFVGGDPIETWRIGEDLANVLEQRDADALGVGEVAGGELSKGIGDEFGPIAAGKLGDGEERAVPSACLR